MDRIRMYGIYQSGLQAVVWLVQHFLSPDRKSKYPTGVQSVGLDISESLQVHLRIPKKWPVILVKE